MAGESPLSTLEKIVPNIETLKVPTDVIPKPSDGKQTLLSIMEATANPIDALSAAVNTSKSPAPTVEFVGEFDSRVTPKQEEELFKPSDETKTLSPQTPDANQQTTGDLILREMPALIPENGIGNVILKLKDQIESSINFDGNGVQIASEKQLVPSGLVDIDPNSITNPLAKDAYNLAVSIKSDNESIKLAEQQGKLMVVSERTIDDIKIVEIYDAKLPKTEKYNDYLDRKAKGQLTIDEQVRGFDASNYTSASSKKKEDFTPTQNLIIVDVSNGTAFDFRSLLPSDWELRNYLSQGDAYFSQEFKDKTVSFGKLQTKEDLIKLFHEFGHAIFSANDDPEMYQQAVKLWEESAGELGGLKSLPPDIFSKTVELLARNERGASARALELVRLLKQKGCDLKVNIQQQVKIVESALDTYRKGFGVSKTEFK